VKIVAVYSKYITQTYYGHPVDFYTITVSVDEELPPEAVEIAKENARRQLEVMPVETFPVAGVHGTLMPEYFKRHPNLAQSIT